MKKNKAQLELPPKYPQRKKKVNSYRACKEKNPSKQAPCNLKDSYVEVQSKGKRLLKIGKKRDLQAKKERYRFH